MMWNLALPMLTPPYHLATTTTQLVTFFFLSAARRLVPALASPSSSQLSAPSEAR
jgi:hypothetical protein